MQTLHRIETTESSTDVNYCFYVRGPARVASYGMHAIDTALKS